MFLRRRLNDASTDEELVALLRRGHQAALGVLWDRYAHLLFGVGMKYLKDVERSKDTVAELFLALPATVGKHEVKSFRPWVHTVMRNRCLMLLRGTRHDARESEVPDIGQEEADDAMLREATLRQLEDAITELNDAQRRCIELFHLQRRNYQQVAEDLQLTTEQVRSHLQNGRRNLRIILQRHADQH